MNRKEMLAELRALDFRILWPIIPDWDEDIGFTEREIYVNSQGYGYYACDEMNGRWQLAPVSEDAWTRITSKILTKELCFDDIVGTSLEELEWRIEDCKDNSEVFSGMFAGLLKITKKPETTFFCGDVAEELEFFLTREELVQAMEKKEYDYRWDELTDEELIRWVERLHAGKLEWEW